MTPRPCPCGSGFASFWQLDARGVALCRACERCHDEKMKSYRPDVVSDAEYWADEPIDGEHEPVT